MTRRFDLSSVLLVFCILAVTMAVHATPAAANLPPDPSLPGRYAVGRVTYTVHDSARNRNIPVDLWYPANPALNLAYPRSMIDLVVNRLESPVAQDGIPWATGRFPIIEFSHGSQAVGFQSFTLAEHLASNGYVFVAPTHPGDSIYDVVLGSDEPDFRKTLQNRGDDMRTVLDDTLTRYAAHVDPNRIAAMGHSFGALTALLTTSGLDYPAWNVHLPPDRRVKATVAIGPAIFFAPAEANIAAHTRGPVMILGGTADKITPPEPYSRQVWDALPTDRKFRADIQDATHGTSSDICALQAAVLASPNPVPQPLLDDLAATAADSCTGLAGSHVQRDHDAQNWLIVAFLNRQLMGDAGYAPFLSRGMVGRLPVDYWRCSPGPVCDSQPS